ncbi:MAG TPA: hemolysin III family protein [Burkholderiaceae bacterium]|nr:hemolysin III family protein [Burkholderiaceae bacterium]
MDPPEPPTNTWTQVRPLREEIASATIQGCAALASVVGLATLVGRAAPRHDPAVVAALVVYGASMFLAFLMSALYHATQGARTRSVLQQLDHCTIFLLIAGTYSPVAMLPLRHHGGPAVLVVIWVLAFAGIALRLGSGALYERIAIPLYLVMGWMGLAWGVPLYREIGDAPMLLMLAGGLSYTGGLWLYHWHRLPFSNCLWHLSVVAGSVWFFVAISGFVSS